jgi:hypothetical protein
MEYYNLHRMGTDMDMGKDNNKDKDKVGKYNHIQVLGSKVHQ